MVARRRTGIRISADLLDEARRRATEAGCTMSDVIEKALRTNWFKDDLESDLKAVAAELRANNTEISHCKYDIRDLIHIQAGMIKLVSLLLPNLPDGEEIQVMMREKGNERFGLFLLETALNSQGGSKANTVGLLRKIRRQKHRGAEARELMRLIPELRSE